MAKKRVPFAPRKEVAYNIYSILAVSLKVIKDRKEFIPEQNAIVNGTKATSKWVKEFLDKSQLKDPEIVQKLELEYKFKIREIVEYFKNQTSINDSFHSKIKELINIGVVTDTSLETIVTLVRFYQEQTDRIKKLNKIIDKYTKSKFIGQMNVLDTFVIKIIEIEDTTPLSEKMRYNFSDQMRNLGYFTDDEFNFSLWDCIVIEAIPINQYIDPSGLKRTELKLIKVLKNIGKGSEE